MYYVYSFFFDFFDNKFKSFGGYQNSLGLSLYFLDEEEEDEDEGKGREVILIFVVLLLKLVQLLYLVLLVGLYFS